MSSPKIETSKIKLFLAPMEGVTDFVMRDLLTQIGGIDFCVTEFLRVTDQLYPDHVFYKIFPELKTDGRTAAKIPVYLQLLGGQAEPLAANAQRAVSLGALGIDLNFGCPAKTVNRHDGGATLLKSTQRLYDIVHTVRKNVPEHIPVSAKMRLGFDDPSQCLENAAAIAQAGASWITVHCRTKTDGYKPPAYWEWIPLIKQKINIPIISNGEIWNTSDFNNCLSVTKTESFMIGRGALRNPYIFNEIKNIQIEKNIHQLINQFYNLCENEVNGDYAIARTKQWLNQLRTCDPKTEEIFQIIKIIKKPVEFKAKITELLV